MSNFDPTKLLFDGDAVSTKATSLDKEAQKLIAALEKLDKLKMKMLQASLGSIHDKVESVVGEIMPGMNQQASAIESLAAELQKAVTTHDDVSKKIADKLQVDKSSSAV